MRGLACLVTLATGCGFLPNAATDAPPPGDAGDGGAGSDAPPDTPAGLTCFGTNPIDTVCAQTFPSTARTFTVNTTIDTDGGDPCIKLTANGVPVCVIAFSTLTIPNGITVSVHGSRPLVLVSTTSNGAITLAGPFSVLDVGSHRGGQIGAGPFAGAACTTGATAPTGHGGGYGGTYTRTGGGGGNDNSGGGGGGPANAQSTPTMLHGGCAGSAGGGNTGAAAGGGAVALIATTINILGIISVSGAGGTGATGGFGGNGGGAAGVIVLDALAITGNGSVLGQGGGGGEGSAGNTGGDGHDGYDPLDRSFETLGGTGGSTGGDGGSGGGITDALAGDSGPPGGTNEGGGGGGGAAGITLVFRGVPSLQLVFSPSHA